MADRPWWMPRSPFFLMSMMPVFSEEYEADQCWHGCDKVSRVKKVEGEKVAMFGGGGS